MTTENKRIVGYLPPDYHEKLREYMAQEHISESAALVRMVKQFFDTPTAHSNVPDEIAALKTQMQELLTRVGVLEQLARTRPSSHRGNPITSMSSPVVVRSLTRKELAGRLAVSEESLLEQALKGETEFQRWCRYRDPAKRLWRWDGDLFHPVEED